MATKNRIAHLDLLKCFAIFMVLMGHCIQYFISGEYYNKVGYRIIYSFHMPLFMTLCGYFAWGSTKLTVAKFIKKKFYQLILPAFLFVGIETIFKNWGGYKSACLSAFWSFWFLKCAFICYCLFYIATRLNRLWPKYNIGFILTIIISQFVGMFLIDMMYPCFVLGAIIQRNKEAISRNLLKYTMIPGIVFLTMLIFFDASFWNYSYTFTLAIIPEELITSPDYWWIHFYKLIIGIAGTLFFFGLFELLFAKNNGGSRLMNWLSIIGQLTLGIYILQSYILENWLASTLNFDEINPYVFNLIYCPIISLGVLLACVIIIKATTYIPYASRLLFNYEGRSPKLRQLKLWNVNQE